MKTFNQLVDEGVLTAIGRKKPEKKAQKAMDAGAKARRKVARRVHAKYVSGSEDLVPDDIREGMIDVIKKGAKRHAKAVEKKKIKNRKAVPYAALAAQHEPEGEVLDEADPRLAIYQSGMTDASRVKGRVGKTVDKVKDKVKRVLGKKDKVSSHLDRYRYQSGLDNYLKSKVKKEELAIEAKVDAGKSPEQKEKDRNVRKFGVSHNVAGHGKLRRALHRSDRGDKKIKGDKSQYVEMEGTDKAYEYVVSKLKKKYGDGVLTKRDKIKPQSAADKAKARAHQAKVDKENAAERAKDPSQGRYPKG